jgi:predicted YcjX-like family ATPase
MIGGLVDDTLRAVEDVRDAASEALFEPTLRVGVTGLSRAGKTVFITALVAGLLNRGRMVRLGAQAEGRIDAVALRPQPDRGVPRFAYEDHMAALTGAPPVWPEGTKAVAQLRLSIRYRPSAWLDRMTGALTGPSTLHLDIVDYPGEWLLDLPLLSLSYADWSARVLAAAEEPLRAGHAAAWREAAGAADPNAPFDEAQAKGLAEAWTAYLFACRGAGLSGLTPGRFLMPGELDGSPALTFAPLPASPRRRGTLAREFERRYDAYIAQVVRPFFRDHFARLDRQVVLVDLLGALDAGPGAVGDLKTSLTEVLQAFRPGAGSWLFGLLGRRIDRILIAATKADHVHHTQHPRLTAILSALLDDSMRRAQFKGAKVQPMALAALRATAEQDVARDGRTLPCVRGRILPDRREAALFPGDLPADPQSVLAQALSGGPRGAGWLGGELRVMNFAPPGPDTRADLRPEDGPPHIRLDQALDFLIGDRLA